MNRCRVSACLYRDETKSRFVSRLLELMTDILFLGESLRKRWDLHGHNSTAKHVRPQRYPQPPIHLAQVLRERETVVARKRPAQTRLPRVAGY